MSVHVEEISANCSIFYTDERNIEALESNRARDVVVLGGDDLVLITGSKRAIYAFAMELHRKVVLGPIAYEPPAGEEDDDA